MKKSVALLVSGLCLWPALALGQTTVKLTWDAPLDVVPTGYIMEQKIPPGVWAEVGRSSTLFYDATLDPPPQSVCWRVFAYSSLGKGGPSNELCLAVPGAPGNFTLTVQESPTGVRTKTTVRSQALPKKK